MQQNELSTYLILELLHFTTESSINCDDFVQNLHIRNKEMTVIKKEKLKIIKRHLVFVYLVVCFN